MRQADKSPSINVLRDRQANPLCRLGIAVLTKQGLVLLQDANSRGRFSAPIPDHPEALLVYLEPSPWLHPDSRQPNKDHPADEELDLESKAENSRGEDGPPGAAQP